MRLDKAMDCSTERKLGNIIIIQSNHADQNCPWNPRATPWIAEFLVYCFSANEHQDTHRKDKVKPLIEKFESHQHKESVLQDFKQRKEINKFSKESKDLTADMNNTEIFELCETSSKQQFLDCNFYCEAGIVCCSCGRCLGIFIAKWNGGRQEQQRCSVDTWPCYQKKE